LRLNHCDGIWNALLWQGEFPAQPERLQIPARVRWLYLAHDISGAGVVCRIQAGVTPPQDIGDGRIMYLPPGQVSEVTIQTTGAGSGQIWGTDSNVVAGNAAAHDR